LLSDFHLKVHPIFRYVKQRNGNQYYETPCMTKATSWMSTMHTISRTCTYISQQSSTEHTDNYLFSTVPTFLEHK